MKEEQRQRGSSSGRRVGWGVAEITTLANFGDCQQQPTSYLFRPYGPLNPLTSGRRAPKPQPPIGVSYAVQVGAWQWGTPSRILCTTAAHVKVTYAKVNVGWTSLRLQGPTGLTAPHQDTGMEIRRTPIPTRCQAYPHLD